MIAIIDYGAGNLRSIRRALETNGAETVITSDPDVVRKASDMLARRSVRSTAGD
jgi:glutamine amidotransferase